MIDICDFGVEWIENFKELNRDVVSGFHLIDAKAYKIDLEKEFYWDELEMLDVIVNVYKYKELFDVDKIKKYLIDNKISQEK